MSLSCALCLYLIIGTDLRHPQREEDGFMLNFAHREESDIYTNGKVEYFPGFTRFIVADVPVFREPGWEAEKPHSRHHKPQSKDNQPQERSIRRAKRKIFDIAALNDFHYFVTFTLNQKKIDRQSSEELAHKLKIFLGNKVRRNDMRYLIVPEYHKDGKSIHLHGLVSGNFQLLDSGLRAKDGRIVYNVGDWTYGFSTCLELNGDREAVARYIAKYVTKDTKKILGNFYYAGGNIQRVPEREYVNLQYDEIASPGYYVSELGVSFKYLTVKGATA